LNILLASKNRPLFPYSDYVVFKHIYIIKFCKEECKPTATQINQNEKFCKVVEAERVDEK